MVRFTGQINLYRTNIQFIFLILCYVSFIVSVFLSLTYEVMLNAVFLILLNDAYN